MVTSHRLACDDTIRQRDLRPQHGFLGLFERQLMRRTAGRPGVMNRDELTGSARRVESRMLNEAQHIRLLTRSHPIVLFLDAAALVIVICYLIGGASPHTILLVGCFGIVLVRVIRQLRDKQHIPLNIVSKAGTVVYVLVAITLIATTAKAPNGVTALVAVVAAIVHLSWRYLQWSLDITALTHRQLWRIIGVATDDTPSMRFDSYGPPRVRRSTVSKAISGSPVMLAWAADAMRFNWLSSKLRSLSTQLEYGDFIADGPSQQDAVLGWVHAIPRPYVFKSYVTDAQTTRSSSQSEATTQPLSPVRPHML